MKRLESLACELARLLAVEVRREGLQYRPREQMALTDELLAASGRVRTAGRAALLLLDTDQRKAVASVRNGWSSKAAIVAALAAVGAALSRTTIDDAPDTPRDPDDTATEAP